MTKTAWIGVLLLTFGAAHAQAIYKCKGPHGEVIYRQSGCDAAERMAEVRTYQEPPPQESFTPVLPAPRALPPQPIQERAYQVQRGSAYSYAPSVSDTGTFRPSYRAPTVDAPPLPPRRRIDPPPTTNTIGQHIRVLDTATGQYIEGIRTAPNQLWDPATGQYLQTNP